MTESLVAKYWQPRHWPAWCLYAWMRLCAVMPFRFALGLHNRAGRLFYRIAPNVRRVVRRNLELCFPELSAAELDAKVLGHFEALAMSLAETAFAWFGPEEAVTKRFDVLGIEHLERAIAQRRGVLLYTGHFTTLEICGRPLKSLTPCFAVMMSHRSSPLLDEVQRRARFRLAHEVIPSHSVRHLLRSLERNAVVWYAPDLAYRQGKLIPFFHELAMTNVATSRIARLTGAVVLPFSYRRIGLEPRYEIRFHAPLDGFPSDDAVADTRRLVGQLESFIRAAPEQYLWIKKRFGGRPAELPDLYHAPGRSSTLRPVLPPDLAFSVVIPVNNEERNVRPLITELRGVVGSIGRHELIVVDDGSDDRTAEAVRSVANATGPIRLLRHAWKRGQSTAIYNGIRAATHEIVVVLDGDLQNDPKDIPILLERYFADSDLPSLGMLIGHRTKRHDSSLRKLSSRIANGIRARVLGDRTPDTGCGLKVLKRSAFLELPYFDHMHRFLPALMQRAGYRVISVPVAHRPRLYSEAHYGVWDRAWVGIVDLVGVLWLMRRSRPLEFQEEHV